MGVDEPLKGGIPYTKLPCSLVVRQLTIHFALQNFPNPTGAALPIRALFILFSVLVDASAARPGHHGFESPVGHLSHLRVPPIGVYSHETPSTAGRPNLSDRDSRFNRSKYLQLSLQGLMRSAEGVKNALYDLESETSDEEFEWYWTQAFELVGNLHRAFHMLERAAIDARIADYVSRGLGYPTRLRPPTLISRLSTSGR